jgi:hypothetical protein
MKKMQSILRVLLAVGFAALAQAQTTIDPINNDAYGANIGWINAQGDVVNGMVVGDSFCWGYIYSANCGWIHLGNGNPQFGQKYGNNSASNYGVNHDGLGNLTGYAYGANIGWVNFEQTYGKPKVDLMTGVLSGYVWGANVGWIALNTAQGYVKTMTIDPGPDTDGDGIPDAWEYRYFTFGRLALGYLSADGDYDGDGVSDYAEYLADTDPTDPNDRLLITDFAIAGSTNTLTWTAKPTRAYMLQRGETLTNWVSGVSSIPSSGPEMSEEVIGVTNATKFYRVKAALPLSE